MIKLKAMKEVQRKKAILEILKSYGAIGTANLCKLLERRGLSANSSTISAMLYNMVKSGELIIGVQVGPKGGKTYRINTEKVPRKFERKIFTIKFPTIHEHNH